MNLADWIDRWAGFAPEKTAIRLEGRLLSYAAMADEIARLAGVLRNDLAIEPGDRVAFVGFNSPENLLLLFACARVGAILLPLNWRLAAPEHSYIVNDCTPKALFAGADFVVQVESNRDSIDDMHLISCGGETPPGWHSYADLVGGAEPLPRGPGALGDTVLICYTSGTTGQPKGTLLDQNALSWTAVNGAHMHDLTSADLILSTLPLFHVGELNIQTLPALHAGATVELHAKFDPADALHAIAERRPTLAVLVPAQLQAMMALPEWESTDLSCFRMVSTGSTFVSLPLIRAELPGAYLTVSTDLLPSIRFYERVSTTALNSYIGPILDHYLNQLTGRLKQAGFNGILLIMQSNGGVMSPEVARQKAALTLLSGPAAGPGAGLEYARAHDQSKCIVVDMGGTSFEAALVADSPIMVNDGQIDRHRIALPMLGIHTIGAGGGPIGWIDEGGLLRMGPQSAGADPGPACYAKGGELPATTDANVVLGYLDPNYFAGGKMSLDVERARRAIETHVAKPLGLSIEAAAAGMYRIACTNMAQGVREVSIKRGFDAREFPLVVAGGAGPIHSCLICDELEVPLQIVPRESSILCAVGMLMSDLKHDFVRTFVSPLYSVDWTALRAMIEEMVDEGDGLLDEEGIGRDRRSHAVKFDCRYLKQYHEVSFVVPPDAIAAEFHREHNRLYGYSLEDQAVPIEIINVRTQAMGRTERPEFRKEPFAGTNPSAAKKGERRVYIPEREGFETVPVYDGHALRHSNLAVGPAIIEEVTTAIFVGSNHDCVCDSTGSFVMYRKDRADLAERILEGGHA